MLRNFVNSYKLKKFYSKLLHKNQLCFDIGANVGKKSEIFLKAGAKVIAFEPQKSCIPELVKLKNKYKNFHFKSVALDNKEGFKSLFLSNYSEIATLSTSFVNLYKNKNINWKNQEQVETITINKAIKLYGLPNYCKIDVEGHEYEILSILKFKISLIEFEVIAGFQEKAIELIKILNNKNTLFNYTLNEQPKFMFKDWVKVDKIIEVIKAFPKDLFHANIFIKTP